MRRAVLRARITRPYWQYRFHSFGTETIVLRPGSIFGAQQIAIGSYSIVFGGSYLSVETPAWDKPGPVLSIGDRVGVGPYSMISASESIVIEDDVIMGALCGVIDSDHTFAQGRPNVMHNSVASEPVRIGRGTWLAERVAVLKGSTIGRCCIVGTNSVVRGDLPDYSIAAGSPARIVGEVSGVDADAPAFRNRVW
jgi:acetyltransferase-like isoleucine patch superfamily enzyme